ncbi:MAG: methionyl-tRNA formyltransferase [Lacipirellulaceae bacterium]
MKLVALGTGPFAVPSLGRLVADGHDVACVVTRPPRGRASDPPAPMAAAAARLGLSLWQPLTVNDEVGAARLASFEADLLVVCDYGEILKPAALAATRLGGVNLHGSLLPKYRGAAPVQWAVLNGDTQTGVTVIEMTPGLDAGPSLGQSATPIDPDETAGELEVRLSAIGAELVSRVVRELEAGTAVGTPQETSLMTKAPRLAKEHGLVDWSRPAARVKDQVRGTNPWPRAFTAAPVEKGPPLRLVIDRVRVVEGAGAPGEVLDAGKRLVVACGEGAVELLEVQPAGKRRMAAEEFLRGTRLASGARLC